MVGTRLSDILAHDLGFTRVFIILCITLITLILNNDLSDLSTVDVIIELVYADNGCLDDICYKDSESEWP